MKITPETFEYPRIGNDVGSILKGLAVAIILPRLDPRLSRCEAIQVEELFPGENQIEPGQVVVAARIY